MAKFDSTVINGNLNNRGAATFGEYPLIKETGNYLHHNPDMPLHQKWGTFYIVNEQSSTAATSIFAQDPLSTDPQTVEPSGSLPTFSHGNIAALRLRIRTIRINSSGCIFMTKPKGATGSGNDWTRFGVLQNSQADSIYKDFIVPTDPMGAFEIWGYTSTWQPRIERIHIRGFWLLA